MRSKTEFVNQVTQAYGHLYDLVYLRTHPLADVIAPSPSLSRKEKAWETHRILANIIGELEPKPQVPVISRQWRRHRLMVLRYIEALDPEAVWDQLGISRRHYYRELKIATEALAEILWDRYVLHPSPHQQMPGSVEEQASLGQMELLRMETARMAQAGRYVPIGDVIRDLLPLLQEVLQRNDLDVEFGFSESLPSVSVDRSLLRQMLLGMLGHLVDYAKQATIHVDAQANGATVHLSVRVRPPAAVLPKVQDEMEEQLAMLKEMAELSGTRVVPAYSGKGIVGFDVTLPTTQRTVLIVDDNEDVVELFRRYLASQHYHVVVARKPEDVLECARSLQPYAITLDLMMPNQDGWDLLQALGNQPDTQDVPIIVCSVLKQKSLALSLGAVAFLEKPVTQEELLGVLQALG
jgi:CheY-like chemotaxis protein